MDTTAEYDADAGEYVLNGTKQFITNATVANSVLVKAVTDSDAGYDASRRSSSTPQTTDSR